MTADMIVRAYFDGHRLACWTCGLIGEVRVVTSKARLYRWDHVVCLCGVVLIRVTSPEVLVPFGYQAREPLRSLDARGLQWLHGRVEHPWVLALCCLLLGCPGCMESYGAQMAKIWKPLPRTRPAFQ